MSPRRGDSGYFGGAKKPPPEHGIKLHKAGTTWWGERWIAALESVLRGDRGRLSRGRSYARAGRTHDLTVEGGTVRARVTGSRSEPYEVTLALTRLSDEIWARAIAAMSERALFAAELLTGQMPGAIDEVFVALKSSLFPRVRSDLTTTCTCPDWGDPCKHVAATHYVLGEALDRDPFLLFALRGRTREQVLAELRVARAGEGEGEGEQGEHGDDAALGSTSTAHFAWDDLRAEDYDAPLVAPSELRFCFEPPPLHGAVLRQLGIPATWSDATSPAEALLPVVQQAADAARKAALADGPSAADTHAADSMRMQAQQAKRAAEPTLEAARESAPMQPATRAARAPRAAKSKSRAEGKKR